MKQLLRYQERQCYSMHSIFIMAAYCLMTYVSTATVSPYSVILNIIMHTVIRSRKSIQMNSFRFRNSSITCQFCQSFNYELADI